MRETARTGVDSADSTRVSQCDTGNYTVQTVCRNLQTGQGYVVETSTVVSAPNVATATCNSGNVAESVQAVPR